jgi:hypothetical protein
MSILCSLHFLPPLFLIFLALTVLPFLLLLLLLLLLLFLLLLLLLLLLSIIHRHMSEQFLSLLLPVRLPMLHLPMLHLPMRPLLRYLGFSSTNSGTIAPPDCRKQLPRRHRQPHRPLLRQHWWQEPVQPPHRTLSLGTERDFEMDHQQDCSWTIKRSAATASTCTSTSTSTSASTAISSHHTS